MNRKAVSTAITSIMLLSLVIALTAGTYVLTTKSIDTISPTAKTAFGMGERVSDDLIKRMEEEGLGMPALVDGDYVYGDPKDIQISFEKSAAYVEGIPGYFRVFLDNPKPQVIRVPYLIVELYDPDSKMVSGKVFQDLEIADRLGNPIGFTPKKAGDYTINAILQTEGRTSEIKRSPDTFEVSAAPVVGSGGGGGSELNEGEGSSTFTVSQYTVTSTQKCVGVTATECDDADPVTGVRPFGSYSTSVGNRMVAIGKAYSGTGQASVSFSSISNSDCDTGEEKIVESYSEGDGHYIHKWRGQGHSYPGGGRVEGVNWDEGTVSTQASAWSYYTYSDVDLRVSGFNTQNTDLMRLTKNLLGICGYSLSDASGAGGSLCKTCLADAKTVTWPEGASYIISGHESGIVAPDEPTCIKDATLTYAPMVSKSFTLPLKKIDAASLILVPRGEDLTVQASLNNNMVTDGWMELSADSPTELSVTGRVIPGTHGNKIDLWLDPKAGEGEHTVDWMVVSK